MYKDGKYSSYSMGLVNGITYKYYIFFLLRFGS